MERNEGYKLPKCWIGHPSVNGSIVGEHTDKTLTITENDCNPKCHCLSPMQAHFCMEGHMTECRAGMDCEEAECSHYVSDYYEDEDYI